MLSEEQKHDFQTPYERNKGNGNDQTPENSNIETCDNSTPSLRYK